MKIFVVAAFLVLLITLSPADSKSTHHKTKTLSKRQLLAETCDVIVDLGNTLAAVAAEILAQTLVTYTQALQVIDQAVIEVTTSNANQNVKDCVKGLQKRMWALPSTIPGKMKVCMDREMAGIIGTQQLFCESLRTLDKLIAQCILQVDITCILTTALSQQILQILLLVPGIINLNNVVNACFQEVLKQYNDEIKHMKDVELEDCKNLP